MRLRRYRRFDSFPGLIYTENKKEKKIMEAIDRIIAGRNLDFTTTDGERRVGDQMYVKGDAEIGTGW